MQLLSYRQLYFRNSIGGKMKRKNIVAVVGRPNVGKSTLFNALAGKNISIVKDTPGVTRDRLYRDVEWLNHTFTLVDTGGIEPDSRDVILSQMREQAQIAIDTADVILFMVDAKQGVTDADAKVADMLRRSGKPVILTVNKVDNFGRDMLDVYEFYNLGIGDPHPISAANQMGIGDLLEEIVSHFKDLPEVEEDDDSLKVAIIGKPNVGKSSIINKLIGENRLIVSDVAGTTRDAIDTEVVYHGRKYTFIDTAGLRRKNKIKEELEEFMILRTVTAVERADVAIVVINAEEGVTEQDAKIAGIAHERGKAVIIAVNKWDLIEKDNKSVGDFTKKVRQTLSFMPYAEILFVSAQTGQRLTKLYDLIDVVSENHAMRVATGVLNEILTQALVMQQPPSDKGRMLKVFYITQVAVKPPTFVIFVNDKKLMHFSYTRYIENQIREAFGFKGTPLRFIVRERGENEQD
jgi:GTP-binding protein